ncbi:MAG: hypothetical protein FJ387_24705 [Verrucomicrobia bacterium]|nr:hypothetical protein [Verrucomicrobiota bacterium]
MIKFLVILFVSLIFESIGVLFLKEGLTQVGQVRKVTPAEIVRVVKTGATNGKILLGVFFEALFFAGLLILMSKSDVSFLWPMTSLSFVFATLAARIFLHEYVSGVRWSGVVLIVLGAGLITWTEHRKPQQQPAPPLTRLPAQTP